MNGIFVWWTLVGDPVSLYADDVAIVLRDLKQLTAVIELIQQCRRYTGLTLNLLKTVVFTMQQKAPKEVQGILVTHDPVKYLGAFLGTSNQPEERNFEHILCKFKTMASKWQSHSLILPAQVVVLRSLILLLLIF